MYMCVRLASLDWITYVVVACPWRRLIIPQQKLTTCSSSPRGATRVEFSLSLLVCQLVLSLC